MMSFKVRILMIYEQTHIKRYHKDEKNKKVAFTTETSEIPEDGAFSKE